jgi:hypothetical protein
MAQGSVSVTAPPGLAGARELLRRVIRCRPLEAGASAHERDQMGRQQANDHELAVRF